MPSERRLHPLSFLFTIAGQVRQLAVPGLVVLFGAGTAGVDWQAWLVLLLIPYAAFALVEATMFRYRFEAADLVIRSGLLFRNERHVPYVRIQNIDAVQGVLHRLLHVVEVRIETGGGNDLEAHMRVLPLPALDELRARVAAGRAGAPEKAPDEAVTVPATPRRTVLSLRLRELLLAGFIDSRGLIIVGAAFGLLSELGLFDSVTDRIFGTDVSVRDFTRQIGRAVAGGGLPSVMRLAALVGSLAGFIVLIRLLSMVWSAIRLWGFRLDKIGDDLAVEFGILTRVIATIPLRRIQTVTIVESPLHRLCRTVSIRVDSAGGQGGEGQSAKRESLAPIVRRADAPLVLAEVLPDVRVEAATWSPVHPRAFRRKLKSSLLFAGFCLLPFVYMLKWWTIPCAALAIGWAVLHAKYYVENLGWAIEEGAVLFRSGWLWRETTIARFNKIQVVTLDESPFDRRAGMASVRVDTAGAGAAAHHVSVPYLGRPIADGLYATLTAEAARTAFKW